MAVVVNTGILTGYHSFHFNSCLIPCSDFMQVVFSGCCGYSEIPIVVPSVSYLSLLPQACNHAGKLYISQHSIPIPQMYVQNVL
jgi:hypothetical protein